MLRNLDLKLLMVSCARWSGIQRKHKVSLGAGTMTAAEVEVEGTKKILKVTQSTINFT